MSIEPEINQVRRKDREVTDEEWIKDFLRQGAYGSSATVSDGQPFINTNLYVYDEGRNAIYFHSYRGGRTSHNVEADGRICFSVTRVGRLLPAKAAAGMSVEYASVVVFGKAEVVQDKDEARYGLRLLVEKYFPALKRDVDYQDVQDRDLERTAVYRIEIERWSAKQKKVAEDFPGAFYFQNAGE